MRTDCAVAVAIDSRRDVPDQDFAAHKHDERPDDRRCERAACDRSADLERVLVLGMLLFKEHFGVRDALLVRRAREHVFAVHERKCDRKAKRNEKERSEEDVVASVLDLGLRRVDDVFRVACGSALELRAVVLLVLLRHGDREWRRRAWRESGW